MLSLNTAGYGSVDQETKKVFFKEEYPSNHWAMQPKTWENENLIAKEPNMLHGHVYGPGNPDEEYIKGVKLGGPRPGEIFDMRAKSPEVKGNDGKVKWKEGEMEIVAAGMKKEMEKVKIAYEDVGLNVVTD